MSTTVVRSGILLQGDMLDTALRCVLIASHARVTNGLPESRAYRQLAEALAAAMSAARQCDVAEPVPLQHYPRVLRALALALTVRAGR
jgi:hypothetical protein